MPLEANKVVFGIVSLGLYWVFLHMAGLDAALLRQVQLGPPVPIAAGAIRWNAWILAESAALPCVAHNLSGITSHQSGRTLFAVTTDPPESTCLRPTGHACGRSR